MSAIDYQTTLDNLDTAIAGASGANLELLQDARTRIAELAAKLVATFDVATSAAKDDWVTAASAAFTDAQDAADYMYTSAGGTPPAALTFDTYDAGPLLARIETARAVQGSKFARDALEKHRDAFRQAFFEGPTNARRYTRSGAASLERQISTLLARAAEAIALEAL